MSKKIKKYSEIKEKIGIDTLKDTTENSAYLTHYLHNRKNGVSKYYLPQAEEYFTSVVNEPLQEYLTLDLKFDIPFPTPKNHKFTFIDLFGGMGRERNIVIDCKLTDFYKFQMN